MKMQSFIYTIGIYNNIKDTLYKTIIIIIITITIKENLLNQVWKKNRMSCNVFIL